MRDIHHHAGNHTDIPLLAFNHHKGNRRILNLIRQFSGNLCACLRNNLSGQSIYCILCQNLSADSVAQHQFFVELIPAYFCQIVSSGVKEHAGDQALGALYGQGLSRTYLLVQLQKAFLVILCRVLAQGRQDLGLLAEELQDLRIGSKAQGTHQYRDGNLSGPVYTHVKNVIGIRLILQPCAAVGNHGTGIQAFSYFIMINCIVNTRGTNKLTDNDTFCTVDHKRTGLRHQRQITHENLVFINFIGFFIIKTYLYFQRSCIRCISFLAFLDCIFNIAFACAKCKINKFKTQLTAVIGNRRNVVKHFPKSLIQKPSIGIFLNLDQIRHFQNFFLS
ncbi:hypothetical protein IMSAGC007_03807 [Lachnospiraceae bacterium]|nr:hypothetical protein IMSAGC007_03807 [Lachnospiraceae bacterium]